MAVLKKFNLVGKEVGQIAIEDEMLKSSANSQMIKDYIIALRENARQWSANTKSRDEVNHSGKKPHPQKGLAAPDKVISGRLNTKVADEFTRRSLNSISTCASTKKREEQPFAISSLKKFSLIAFMCCNTSRCKRRRQKMSLRF